MGASLLVFANKTDVGGCMTDNEIAKVRDWYCTRTVKVKRTTDTSRDCNSMQLRRTSGLSFDVVQSRGNISRKDWHGWCRTQKKDCFCTESSRGLVLRRSKRIATLATPRTRLELIGCSWWGRGADQEKKV